MPTTLSWPGSHPARLPQADVIEQLLDEVPLVSPALVIAVGPVAAVRLRESVHGPVHRGARELLLELGSRQDSLGVVADQDMAGARHAEQFPQGATHLPLPAPQASRGLVREQPHLPAERGTLLGPSARQDLRD